MSQTLGSKCLKIGLQITSSSRHARASFTSTCVLNEKCKFLIAGGGTGGITMAARLLRMGEKSVTVIEPSEVKISDPLAKVFL